MQRFNTIYKPRLTYDCNIKIKYIEIPSVEKMILNNKTKFSQENDKNQPINYDFGHSNQ